MTILASLPDGARQAIRERLRTAVARNLTPAGLELPHAARLGAPGPGAVVKTRTAVALVTLAVAVPAFALTPRLFPSPRT